MSILPECGIPQEFSSLEAECSKEDELSAPDLGPQNDEDVVFSDGTEVSSFMPNPEGKMGRGTGYKGAVMSIGKFVMAMIS